MRGEELASKLERLTAQIQEGDRPLPWVMHDGCSYRRIASQPTRENPRSFADGNVLHATKCWHDGHPDLSMGGDQLAALVEIVNSLPAILAALREQAPSEEMVARAICRAHAELHLRGFDEAIECQVSNGWDLWTNEARAAIAAMGGRM